MAEDAFRYPRLDEADPVNHNGFTTRAGAIAGH
jgi:hypothetical protein